jgi:protein-disulfide isomerase
MFWPMHDILFARQGEWQGDRDARRRMDTYAAELGLDGAAFGQCLASHTHESAIKAATQEGARGGVDATPTFLVDGRQVGTAELFAAIDAALRAKGQ